MMRMHRCAAVLSAALMGIVASGCSDESSLVIKVQAFRSGELTLNGAPATVADLQRHLDGAKDRNAVVWYYREGAELEPTDGQFEAIKAIVEAQVPISLSTKEDFSDYVGADGLLHPRSE